MSPRYTGEATMEEPALRDIERWRDKIEVRLDNRQVFFLFFGSAMVACMLFVLGVLVGKRLESRGRAEAPAVEDPLAALDRFGTAPAPAAPAPLAFPRALIGNSPPKPKLVASERSERADRSDRTDRTERTERTEHNDRLERSERSERLERAPARPTLTTTTASQLGSATAPAGSTSNRIAAAPPDRATSKPAPSAPDAVAAASAPSGKLAALPHAFAPSAGPQARTSAASANQSAARDTQPNANLPSSAKTQPVAAAGKPTASAAAIANKAKTGHYLLQLSSFQDRADADAFAHRFADRSAYVVATEIPGKGTWYRVRVGSYVTLQEATTAKSAFEREHNVIAYVAGGGAAK